MWVAVPFVVASEDPKAKEFVAKARAKAGTDWRYPITSSRTTTR